MHKWGRAREWVPLSCYGLVICNHGPPSPGEGGDGRGIERGFAKILPPQFWGNTRGLLYIDIKGCEMKR